MLPVAGVPFGIGFAEPMPLALPTGVLADGLVGRAAGPFALLIIVLFTAVPGGTGFAPDAVAELPVVPFPAAAAFPVAELPEKKPGPADRSTWIV